MLFDEYQENPPVKVLIVLARKLWEFYFPRHPHESGDLILNMLEIPSQAENDEKGSFLVDIK